MASGRILKIMQYENNPLTGESLNFTENNIISALSHKTIKDWAYIRHDKDTYSEEDEKDDATGVIKKGMLKPPHWHVVVRSDRAMDVDVIARWFGVPMNYVDIPKGAGAFLDCVGYLPHSDDKQQALGKYLYPDEEIKSNFNWRDELNKRAERKLKYGKDLNYKDQVRHDVMFEGKTLLQCMEEDRINYQNDYKELKRMRLEYINRLKPPKTRLNYYITGQGGVGKGLLSRAIARQMARQFNPELKEDDEMFFIVGSENALFEGYDGQPVIIYDDMRAMDLIIKLGGRGNVFNIFDTHPVAKRQNVKYSSVNLCNVVNIVNSVQDYVEFLDSLAGEYKDRHGNQILSEDKKQSYRRFPIIIPISSDYLEVLGNKGYFDNNNDYEEYISYGLIRGNMERLARKFNDKEIEWREHENRMIKNVVELGHKALTTKDDEMDLEEDFEEYGKLLSEEETIRIKLEKLKSAAIEHSYTKTSGILYYTPKQERERFKLLERLSEITSDT